MIIFKTGEHFLLRRGYQVSLLFLIAIFMPFVGFPDQVKQPIFRLAEGLETPALKIHELGGGLYWTIGEWGANTGFLVGSDGVLVIDAKATEKATKKVVAEIKKITNKPITKVIFTHSDVDCINGFEGYPENAEIICSLGTKQEFQFLLPTQLEMNAPLEIYNSNMTRLFLPAVSFDGQLNFRFDFEQVELSHYCAAHTRGDTIVFFPAKSVAFIGDLVFVGRDPLVQDQKGGYSFGLVRALSILLNQKPEIQTFIPSHADPLGREELKNILKSIEEIQAKVLAMVDEGKTLDEVKKALGIQDPPLEEGLWVWPSLAVTIYRELAEKKIEKYQAAARRS